METIKIDTTQRGQVVVKLEVGGKRWEVERQQEFGSQVLLSMIEEILTKAGLKLTDLESIEVNIGPGSFTGIRVGVSVANALGFSLGIPVNGKKIESKVNYH